MFRINYYLTDEYDRNHANALCFILINIIPEGVTIAYQLTLNDMVCSTSFLLIDLL